MEQGRRMQLGIWKSRDEEKRLLRIRVSQLEPALESQRKKRKEAEEKVRKLERELEEKRKEIEILEKENEELRRQRDRYRGILFKGNRKKEEVRIGEEECGLTDIFPAKSKGKRGGQKGHVGKGRKVPQRVDEVVHVHLEQCPQCGNELDRKRKVISHTVEDIPPLEEVRTRIVRYETEIQWCNKCKKRVTGSVQGIIPGSRLGINVFLYVLIHRYMCRNTWETIKKSLDIFYGLKVSVGTIVAMMHRGREWFSPQYEELLEAIRKSPVKHADETTWRVEGKNHWLWGFFTKNEAYYTVHESRGRGVPQHALAGSHPQDVLIRDDYGGYKKLPFNHQSCWAHLLRKSHEAAVYPTASREVIMLHEKLKSMYNSIDQINSQPFVLKKRKMAYKKYLKELQGIIDTKYQAVDAKKIQTRITNQGANLLTALIFENVPLTNNRAERGIRPMVVTRKISGGSQSQMGAKTHAVQMSILQSTLLQKKPLIQSYKSLLNDLLEKN
jgi:transposase